MTAEVSTVGVVGAGTMGNGIAQNVGVVSATQTALAGNDHQRRVPGIGMGFHQRMGDLPLYCIGQVPNQRRQAVRVGLCRNGPVIGGLKTRRGDELHRPRNLADVAH